MRQLFIDHYSRSRRCETHWYFFHNLPCDPANLRSTSPSKSLVSCSKVRPRVADSIIWGLSRQPQPTAHAALSRQPAIWMRLGCKSPLLILANATPFYFISLTVWAPHLIALLLEKTQRGRASLGFAHKAGLFCFGSTENSKRAPGARWSWGAPAQRSWQNVRKSGGKASRSHRGDSLESVSVGAYLWVLLFMLSYDFYTDTA